MKGGYLGVRMKGGYLGMIELTKRVNSFHVMALCSLSAAMGVALAFLVILLTKTDLTSL